jgi:hypothetical protein
MKASLKLVLLPILSATVLAACGGGGNDNFDDRVGLADPKVRVVHAIPAGPTVTLQRNAAAFAPETINLAYKGASIYLTTGTQSDLWTVQTTASPPVAVGSVTFNADRGHKYTMIAIPDTNPATSLQMIDDPFNKGLVSDNAHVRVFNAALNATNVDVYLTPTTTDINTVAPTFAAIGYKRALPATGSDSLEVEGGAYVLRITAAGAVAPKAVIFSAPVTLDKNADWLLLPIPASATPNDLKVLVVQSDAATPAVELTNTP